MADLRLMIATLAFTLAAGCGNGAAAGPDGGSGDGAPGDAAILTDAPPVGLSGTLRLNHAAIPDGVKGWVLVFDQSPGVGTNPIALVPISATGAWSFPTLDAGSYFLLGAVDVNRSGELDLPGTSLADPFVVLGPRPSPAAGIVIDVLTARAMVGSARVAVTGGDENQLMVLWASVLDPRNANALTDATVVVSDGAAQFPLAFSTTEVAYVPGTTLSAASVDGTYTFTVSHPLAYQTPLAVEIQHHPLLARPTIRSPTAQQQFGAVQDVQVTWERAATTSDSSVEVHEGTTRVYRAEAIMGPFTIPASAAGFTAGHTYRISVTDVRYGGDTNLISVEAGVSEVTVSF